MNTEQPSEEKEYSEEPWNIFPHLNTVEIQDANGNFIVGNLSSEDANRIVACVNFCATVPQDEISHGFLKAYKDVIQQQGRDIELLKAERNGWQQRAIAAENPPPKDFANPEGQQFHFRGIHFLFVTEENHPWKNWLCYKHAEGQWVSLFKCESPQLRLLTDLQSRLADLKRECDQLKAQNAELKAEITDREKIQQEQLQIIVNQHDRIEKQHSENSKLKAKADWVDKNFDRLDEISREVFALPNMNELRAILASEGKE